MKWFVLIIMLALMVSPSRSQVLVPSSPFIMNVDYARFQQDASSAYVELYYGFYPRLVSVETSDGEFRGAVRLRTLMTNSTTGQVVRDERVNLAVVVVDTTESGERQSFVTQAGLMLPFGDYRLQVWAVDSLTPTRRDSIDLTLRLNAPTGTLAVSDLELCVEIKASERTNDPFYKNALEVVPNPPLLFGITTQPVVYKYAELYHLVPNQSYTLRTAVLDQTGAVVRESSKHGKFSGTSAVEVSTVNATAIASGRYVLTFSVLDESGVELARTEKAFFVYNPHIQAAQLSAASIRAAEMAGLSSEELAEEFRQAQYIATPEEVRTFSQLTEAEARRDFLAKFWLEVEKGRMERPPVRRADYLQRVSMANDRFRSQARPGWRTDRGRVFILYGEPDQIERFPNTIGGKPYEIWHFYQIENGVQFVFVDRTGFSEYQLVHSTKRGEQRDDGWERLLQ
jgi:GWxTD domain-containing protein